MPLAEAVLLLLRWIASPARLQAIWDAHRGGCYERLLTFAMLTQWIGCALLKYSGSGRRSFEKAHEKADDKEKSCSVQAAYKKLARLPVEVSQAFLCDGTAALREAFPRASERELRESLREFQPCILDGKALKKVAKRLKPLRGLTAGLLGGRALVAMEWKTGLAICMHAHPDGDANDIRFVPELLPVVRQHVAGPRLFVADRAFSDPVQTARFTEVAGDHFLVRQAAKVPFETDPQKPQRSGVDEDGRPFTEEWGWLGGVSNPNRCYLRRIVLRRGDQESVILLTDLTDADRYPGVDLLWLYGERVGIEYLFQEVTEVFGLQGLISSSPQGCIFQFAYCMLLYNMIQVVRAYVAEGREEKVETISAEKLFDDVRHELIAWNIMIDALATENYFAAEPTLPDLIARLRNLLGQSWSKTWTKAPRQRNRPRSPAKRTLTHGSVHRILQANEKPVPGDST